MYFNRLKKRNEDALNRKLEENLNKEMKIKSKRDQANLEKRRHQERMSKTKNSILKARNEMVRKYPQLPYISLFNGNREITL